MKEKMALIAYYLIAAMLVIGISALGAWLFDLIWNSDIPTWLKWALLR